MPTGHPTLPLNFEQHTRRQERLIKRLQRQVRNLENQVGRYPRTVRRDLSDDYDENEP